MAKAFSLASWNVEHFGDEPARASRVAAFLARAAPDVFALLEVEGREVFSALTAQLPGYQFHITEGAQTQEILVGVRGGLTGFFTQRLEFKSGNTYLRPGALLTVTVDGTAYSLLFLHTKSGSKPIGLGIRDDQFERAFRFKKTLDKSAGENRQANYIFLGDFNLMGMDYPFDHQIQLEYEIRKLERDAAKVGMRRLGKNRPATWWNGPGSRYATADLDHVVASAGLRFKSFSGAEIDVRGWPELATEAAQAEWIRSHSDHAMIYLEVEKE
jgi:endonuclease/exonuclease/phosphatase family metal-dependent hydrolase